ncbi:glycosyltransferase family 1 protein [Geomonas terrae]|uniref:Glycosyltransferase family 1 protein n=1 Tax=Geomonas terrae TaxID=2562681 RepID=A0A4S1C9V3_9BACT|nr:glycosyltransferase family 4 protein [Geomonas terrae]TGU70058.1 glycosyltransferase family 1 protein [Geomonas terrae]
MKVALIRQKYTPFGGAERYMVRLIEELVALGHEVHVLASSWDAEGGEKIRLHPVSVARKPGWLKSLTFSLGCKRIIERERFDVVFSLERTLRQDIYRAGDGCHRIWLRRKNLGRGWLARLATYLSPFQLAYMALERRLYTDPALAAVIANSEMGKREIVELYGVPEEKIRVVYNGVDAASFPLQRREEYRARLAEAYGLGEELRILYVGSGFKRKGVPALIEAAAKITVPFKLFIVGKGRTGALMRRAQRLGVAQQVVFTGPVRDVERFYLGCDIFAFPTLYDPFSNATLEAMACGLPVVTSRYNGVAELIRDGEQGVVLRDPLDAGEIAAAVAQLADPLRRLRMGAAAAEAAAPLTMQRNSRETLEVIGEVLEKR